MTEHEKSLGKAIDEIVTALKGLNDSSRLVALKAASDYLGLTAPANPTSIVSAQLGAVPAPATAPTAITDIKTLKEAKKPASAIEMACVVGFYLQDVAPPSERKTEMTVAEIDKYFRQAGYPLPKAQRQLLTDAKVAGYFDSPSRGAFKLNAVGYNLVAHRLPRGASSSPDAQTPKLRRATRKRTSRTIKM